MSKNTPITLTAKDVDTLQEFQVTLPFETEYLYKLEKWIAKRRFNIDKVHADCKEKLQIVVEIFSFTLDPVERDDFEMLKEEFFQLQKMSRELDDEILLFNYSVFGTTNWSDNSRKGLTFP